MNTTLFREYKFKFYLNANHFIIIEGKEGQIHPHTWEFMVNIRMDNEGFVQFDQYEKAIDAYFEQYQNKLLNEISPFDHVVPTLENMSDHFIYDIREIVKKLGGMLVKMESSETPTRSYVISFENDQNFVKQMQKNMDDKISTVIDNILDGIVE